MYRARQSGAPADADVPGAVQHVGVKALEQRRQLIGEHALGDAADIEAQTRRTVHGPGARVDRDLAPALVGMGSRGGPGRRQGQRRPQVGALSVEVALVARALDLVGQRGVDQAAGVARRRERRLDHAPHQRADGDRGGRVAIDAAQLAVLGEA